MSKLCVLQGLSDATIRAIQAPPASIDEGPVRYPSFSPGATVPVDGYAAYPEVSPVSESPRAIQRTELFMDYYSDVSR